MAFELKKGANYQIKMVDHTYPVIEPDPDDAFSCVDTGNVEVVCGRTLDVTILGYPNDRPGFVEVQNHQKDKVHLIHLDSIEKASKT